MVMQSVQRYHDELSQQDYQLMAYQVEFVLDRLYELKEAFRRVMQEGAQHVTQNWRDLDRPDGSPDPWVLALPSLAQAKTTGAGGAQNDPA
jgi:hypothetical protein